MLEASLCVEVVVMEVVLKTVDARASETPPLPPAPALHAHHRLWRMHAATWHLLWCRLLLC